MYRIKGLKGIRPERFRVNDVKELKEKLLSEDAGRVPERVKRLARELLQERPAEEIVSLLLSKVMR